VALIPVVRSDQDSSRKAVDVVLDGESLAIEPPLSFSIRHEPLRVRLPLPARSANRQRDAP
jgi:hypothetical protein